jgi:hypothetical protein
MKVEGPGLSRIGGVKRRSGTAESGFAQALEEESAPTQSTGIQGAGAPMGIGALLAAQGDTQEEQEKRAKARGEEMLRMLDMLRMDLLDGRVNPSRLNGLAHVVKTARETTFDPRLNEILDEIELRAAVELAKYT